MTNTQSTQIQDEPDPPGQSGYPYVVWGFVIALLPLIIYFLSASRKRHLTAIETKRRRDTAASDFEVIAARWIDAIIDRQQRLPTGWTVSLRGPFNLQSRALEEIRAESLIELEPVMRQVRANLNDVAKGRLDAEWRKYKDYQIEGRDVKDPKTGQEFTIHDECKKGLADCLEQMKKMAREI